MLLVFSGLELYFFGLLGGVGWRLEKVKLKITSAKVDVEVEDELGNISLGISLILKENQPRNLS